MKPQIRGDMLRIIFNSGHGLLNREHGVDRTFDMLSVKSICNYNSVEVKTNYCIILKYLLICTDRCTEKETSSPK